MMEDRIREALSAEAARVVPRGDPGGEHLRRVARGRRASRRRAARRRPRLAVPAVAAVAVAAVALSPLVLRMPRGGGQAGAPGQEVDGRYRPSGAVVGVGGGTSMWFSAHGLCWRLARGGGDCKDWRLEPGSHAGVVGTRPGPVRVVRGRRQPTVVVFGVADDRVSGVAMTGAPSGGRVIAARGLPWRIWQVTFDERWPGGLSAAAGQVTFTSGSRVVGRLSLQGSGDQAPRPRPLTPGVPLFTYRQGGKPVTMLAYRDGDVLGFGTEESHAAGAGRGRYFGAVQWVAQGPDTIWWYGFMSPRMSGVKVKLRDGRELATRIVDLGGGRRAFSVRLDGVDSAKRKAAGTLIGYDASGAVLATWAI